MIKVIAYLPPSYSRVVRCEQIFKYLNRTGEFECIVSPTEVRDEQLLWADIVFVKETVDPQALALYWSYKVERGKILIVDRDDAIKVEDTHPLISTHKEIHAVSWQQELLKIASHVICTNRELSEEITLFNDKISIIPNYLDMELWDKPLSDLNHDVTRIGWSGSVTHRPDLDIAIPAINKILDEFPRTKFYSCGDPYPQDYIKRCEFIPGTPDMYWWPKLAQTLQYDIALAPLQDTHFNRCRSNLKFLEYAMLGSAGVYSPTVYTDSVNDHKTGIIAPTTEDFYEGIKELILNSKLRKSIAKQANSRVRHFYALENHWGRYARLFKDLYARHHLQNS